MRCNHGWQVFQPSDERSLGRELAPLEYADHVGISSKDVHKRRVANVQAIDEVAIQRRSRHDYAHRAVSNNLYGDIEVRLKGRLMGYAEKFVAKPSKPNLEA